MIRPTILILDDSERIVFELEVFFTDLNYTVHTALRPSLASEILAQHPVDIFILDIRLPERDGLDMLKEVKEKYPDMEVIMISGHGDMNKVIQAMRLGASDFFTKPFQLMDIRRAIEQSKKIVFLQHQLRTAESKYALLSEEIRDKTGHELIGKSPAIQSVIQQMMKAAEADKAPVFICGESGTGKELLARGIHWLSRRKEYFFYPSNCSAIPESLFESELFGHVKGAFTGAVNDKIGWFEAAHKGTLFLDEIGDMPLTFQVKLLRVLEDGKIRRVGTNKETATDVRVFSATNKNIEKEIREKRFRKDLFHRLNTFIIRIPPLRERKEDIPLLLEYYISYYAKKLNKNIQKISPSLVEKCCDYFFEGNVRELKNLAERAVILCEGTEIREKHFPGLDSSECLSLSDYPPVSPAKFPGTFNLAEMERHLIGEALKHCDNNKSKAAKLLHISWNALHRKMTKYKIRLL